ncbi:glutamate decarboxylase [Vagococcus sp. BWB3-3]|uniref:Glutamate decarboxylase n=1 Tax=Vagococcus allomyrinae TaxID=2794353 RepID=A0A940P427_9ENTE|nr:glutamate decarboxylase [Vagococcus allomyrinae]MBP1041164.1 glutamate decarboxylase [Vagococcus allomyrinae]
MTKEQNFLKQNLPEKKLLDEATDAGTAYEVIKSYLIDEGNSRQNLATFCQTYMDDEAIKLMSETFDKNAIDKSEYPRTAKLESYCVNILADLWNTKEDFIGTSTVGSSEACMLGGMAMKFRWRKLAAEKGVDINKQKPNLVISSGYQVCWEKFGVYWDVELREVPIDPEHLSLDMDHVFDYVDDYTIGIVGILGITYTGKFDNIEELDRRVEQYNQEKNGHLVIHVDGASGGMFVPFTDPDLAWDFRLKNVVSINTSGHKYGLVYPGVGWILWRDRSYLPEELIFEVSYLGGNMPTMAINFSRGASQIIGQYYNFLKLGKEGYRQVHMDTRYVAMYLAKQVEETGLFDIYNDGANIPIVCYTLKKDKDLSWDLYDLADRLLMKGWQVPAYPLPANLTQTIIQRFVCRADLTLPMAKELVQDFKEAINELNEMKIIKTVPRKSKTQGFTH